MLKINVEVKGPPPGALMAAALQSVADQLRERVQHVRCPEHGTPPEAVTVVASSMNEIRLKFTVCCEKLRADAEKALA